LFGVLEERLRHHVEAGIACLPNPLASLAAVRGRENDATAFMPLAQRIEINSLGHKHLQIVQPDDDLLLNKYAR
jgi:hypothetical protein